MKNNPITVYQKNQTMAQTDEQRTCYSEPVELIVGEYYEPKSPSPSNVRETYIERVRETHHHHYYDQKKAEKKPEPLSNEDFMAFVLIPLGVVFLFGLLIGGLFGGT